MSDEKKLLDDELLESVSGGLIKKTPKSDGGILDMLEDPTDAYVAQGNINESVGAGQLIRK